MGKPYTEIGSYRIFTTDTLSAELEWHIDFKNRVVQIIQSGGWLFQEDNKIPVKLKDGVKIFIEKNIWHRIIKGHDSLIISITEFP